jgi:SAM-dependent methyltransferase
MAHLEKIADSPDEIRRRHEANRLAWNEGAEKYREELEETIAFIRAGKSNLHPVERRNLGSLGDWCHTAIHLQCASGRDTLSLWNEGVREVIGIDISDVHIANARTLSNAVNAPAKWYRCDILDVPEELDDTADLLYTGRGALNWLHDLQSWAQIVHRLLKPCGVFHVLDDHPTLWMFEEKGGNVCYSGLDYFNHAESNKGWPATYIGPLDKPVSEEARKHERLWPIASVAQSLINAGLDILYIGEHAEAYWDALPGLPEEKKKQLPMTFSIKARKPKVQPAGARD